MTSRTLWLELLSYSNPICLETGMNSKSQNHNVICHIYSSSIIDSFLNFLEPKRLTGRTRLKLAGKYATGSDESGHLRAINSKQNMRLLLGFMAQACQSVITATSRPKASSFAYALTIVVDI